MKIDVDIKLSKKQLKAFNYLLDPVSNEVGYGGAAYGGKSYLGCTWVLLMALQYPGTRWLIGRKELTNLRKTTYKTWLKVVNDFGLDYETEVHENLKENISTIKRTNSEVYWFDMVYKPSDPLYTRLGGLELTGYFLDESNEIQDQAISILQTRNGRHLNEKYNLIPKGFETFNPDRNHVYRRYYKPWREHTLPEHRKFIQALPQDNPYTPKSYIESLKRQDEVTKQRLLYGNFEYTDDTLSLFSLDDLYNLFDGREVDSGDMYLVGDIARFGKDKTVLGIWRGLNLVDIEVIDKSDTTFIEQRVRALQAKYNISNDNTVIDEDGVGGGVVDHLLCKGFVGGSSPLQHNKREQNITEYKPNYQNLRTQCYYTLAELVKEAKIKVSTKNTLYRANIIDELSHIKAKDIDKGSKLKIIAKDEIKENLGRSPDFADMLMMRIYFEVQPVKKKAKAIYKRY